MLLQIIQSRNHFQGWSAASPLCKGTGQSVSSVAAECDPSNQVYRSASRNSWTGVICNAAGEVTCIHLAGLGLRTTATSIGILADLPSLLYLNLEGNRLYGELPDACHCSFSAEHDRESQQEYSQLLCHTSILCTADISVTS